MEQKVNAYLEQAFPGEDVYLTHLSDNGFFNYKRGDGWGEGQIDDNGNVVLNS